VVPLLRFLEDLLALGLNLFLEAPDEAEILLLQHVALVLHSHDLVFGLDLPLTSVCDLRSRVLQLQFHLGELSLGSLFGDLALGELFSQLLELSLGLVGALLEVS